MNFESDLREYLKNIELCFLLPEVKDALNSLSEIAELVRVTPFKNYQNVFMVISNGLLIVQLQDYSILAIGKFKNNNIEDLSFTDMLLARDLGFRVLQ